MTYIFRIFFLFAIYAISTFPIHAKEKPCILTGCAEFPIDAGYINVKDYGAKGDGKTDDTEAINAALTAGGEDTGREFWLDKTVYFPAGTYLISSPIKKLYKNGKFASGMVITGNSPASTIIKLKDNAEGYGDPRQPQAIIFTSSKLLAADPRNGGRDYLNKGEGNDAYNNFIENITIDTGKGNNGAIGIDYLANNFGAIRNVIIKAEEGSGKTGISLERKWIGPALIKDVIITGFSTGISVAGSEYGITLENVKLEKQKDIGLSNNNNIVSAHNLQITSSPQPLLNSGEAGLVVIIAGKLQSSEKSGHAFINNGFLNIRNSIINGAKTDGVYEKSKRISSSSQPWSLPIKHPPAPLLEPIEKWVAVKFNGTEKDASNAIHKAFNSGAKTIYFPHGIYYISRNIFIPPSVERIVGMGSTIRALRPYPAKLNRKSGFFRSQSGGNPLTIEKLMFDNSGWGNQVGFESSGKRVVTLKDVVGAGVTTLKRSATGGEVFIENTCCGNMVIEGSEGVWVRQLNSEAGAVSITNNSTPLWILGIKTEGNRTIVKNNKNSITEIMGGLIYMVTPPSPSALPAFINTDAKIYLSYAEEAFNPEAIYTSHLVNIQNGNKKIITAEQLPKRRIAANQDIARMAAGISGW